MMTALTFPSGSTKPLTAAITHLPLLLAVLFSGPALLLSPFLPETWSARGHARLCQLQGWHRNILDELTRPQANAQQPSHDMHPAAAPATMPSAYSLGSPAAPARGIQTVAISDCAV